MSSYSDGTFPVFPGTVLQSPGSRPKVASEGLGLGAMDAAAVTAALPSCLESEYPEMHTS